LLAAVVATGATLAGCGTEDGGLGPQPTPSATPVPTTPTDLPVNGDVKVLRVEPQNGPTLGGTEIVITGQGFQGFPAVWVGPNAAVDVVLIDVQGTTLRAVTDSGPPGCADVRVDINGVGSGLLPCAFTYVEHLTCQRVEAEPLSPEGGTEIVVRGSGFSGDMTVLVGGRPADNVRVETSTTLRADAPVGPPGRANVTVEGASGSARCENAVIFKDFLIVQGVVPSRGSVTGGDEVIVTGNGFVTEDGVVEAWFGDGEAEVLEVLNNDRVRVRTPPSVLAGRVDVRVANLNGEVVASDAFTYFDTVRIDTVTPGTSPAAGGVDFVVRGAGLVDGSVLTVGGRAAIDVRSDPSGEVLRARTPPNDVGPRDVRVINVNGTAALAGAIVYVEGLSVTRVSPSGGPIAGGNAVTIAGEGFAPDAQVRFGRTDAGDVRLLNARNLSAVAPPGRLGPTNVCVSQGGEERCLVNAYHYFDEAIEAPHVLGVSPARGPSSGGIEAEVVGGGFAPDARVLFGDAEAQVLDRVDVHRIRVVVPAHVAGTVDVRVDSTVAVATLVGGFAYFRALTCEAPSPSSGPVEGGTRITLSGSGFTGGVRVRVGALLAETTVIDENTLSAVTPPGSVGPVDVVVDNGEATCKVPRGFVYLDDLQVLAIQPNNGAVAGGTKVTIIGSGFVGRDLVVRFAEGDGTELEVVDPATLRVRTPPGIPGPVDVQVDREGEVAWLPRGYIYFDPTLGFGGTGGGPVDGAVNVTVISGGDGGPISDALVVLEDIDMRVVQQARTNQLGQVVISEDDLRGVQRITAAADGFASGSINDFDAANVTIWLFPLPVPSPGAPPPGVEPPRIAGTIFVDPKKFYNLLTPENGDRACARVATTATGVGAENPPAGDGALVYFSEPPLPGEEITFAESGTYEIISRPGDVSVYAIAGSCRTVNGIPVMIEPVAMGMRHFLFAAPEQTQEGVDIYVVVNLNQAIPIEMDNPPASPSGPNINTIEPFLVLGDGTVWAPTRETRLPPGAVQPEPDPFWSIYLAAGRQTRFSLLGMPPLSHDDVAALGQPSYAFIGMAGTLDGTQIFPPLSTTFLADVTDPGSPAAPVLITPFVDAPIASAPLDGEAPIGSRFAFDFIPGSARPSFNLVFFAELTLFGPVIHWYVILPGDVHEFVLPDVTAAGLQGLPQGAGFLLWQIISGWQPGFDIDNFDYYDVLGGTTAEGLNVHYFIY
jgi:hypothetical protein